MADTNSKTTSPPAPTNAPNTDTNSKTTSSPTSTTASDTTASATTASDTTASATTASATTASATGTPQKASGTVSKEATSTPAVDKTATVNSETTLSDDIKNIYKNVFTSSNIMLAVWFLAAYLLTYVIMGVVSSNTNGLNQVLLIIDTVILVCIFAYVFMYYYSIPENKRDSAMKSLGTTAYTKLHDPYTVLYSAIALVVLSVITYGFHTLMSNSLTSLWLLSTIAGILFTISAIVVFCKDVLGISILDSVLSGDIKKTDSTEKKSTETTSASDSASASDSDSKTTSPACAKDAAAKSPTGEVFNVSNNLYTYEDARAVCSSFGARLATYDEIEDAYTKGGEWCNYGWSEGQMAFFPTQKTTWDELQKNPKAKNNCGRPGVNGGYMENPYIKFGVNCFGEKPKPSDKDLQSMAANKNILHPKTDEDLLMEKKVNFWKENADKLLSLNSFNRNKWSVY